MEALCEEVATMLGSENKRVRLLGFGLLSLKNIQIDELVAKSKAAQEDLQVAKEASQQAQELLLQEVSNQEELDSKITSIAQENQRVQDIDIVN